MKLLDKIWRPELIDVGKAVSVIVRVAQDLSEGQTSHVALTMAAPKFDLLRHAVPDVYDGFVHSMMVMSNAQLERRPPSGRIARVKLERGKTWCARLTLPPDDIGTHAEDANARDAAPGIFYFVVPGVAGAQKIRFEGQTAPLIPSSTDAAASAPELRARLLALRLDQDAQVPRWKVGDAHVVASRRVLLFSIS